MRGLANLGEMLTAILRLPLPITWFFIMLMNCLAAYGVSKLTFDDGLVRAFESKTSHFEEFEEFRVRFPHLGNEILILLETENFAEIDTLRTVEKFVLELSLQDGVSAVISAFSLPHEIELVPSAVGLSEDVPENSRAAIGLRTLRSSSPFGTRFVSKDLNSLLVVVQLSEMGVRDTPGMIERISEISREYLESTNINMQQTGYLAMRTAVIPRLFSDFGILLVSGAFFGTLISIVTLRSVLLGSMVAFSAGTALLWVLGALGLLGVSINVLTVALPALILVLSFADCLHLTFEILKQKSNGHPRNITHAVERIAPACFIASTTTAIAFAVLAFSPSELVSQLGRAGVMSTFLAVIAILIVQPLMFQTVKNVLSDPKVLARPLEIQSSIMYFSKLIDFAMSRSRKFSVIVVCFTVLSAVISSWAPANFSLFETLRDDDQTLLSMRKINADLAPTGSIHFQVERDGSRDPEDLSAAQQFLEHLTGEEVISALSLERIFAPNNVPSQLQELFYSSDNEVALLSGVFRYQDSKDTRQFVEQIERKIAANPQMQQIFTEKPTGLEVMTSFVIENMLNSLSIGFLFAVVGSGALIAFWFRSAVIGMIALIPNLFPIAVIGAWLTVSGSGLEFSSAIALTLAFGLAVDDTTHVLNRIRLHRIEGIDGVSDQIEMAAREALPALVVTSTVLTFGLMGTLFASLPTIANFGALSIAAFALALIADLVILPACLSAFSFPASRESN